MNPIPDPLPWWLQLAAAILVLAWAGYVGVAVLTWSRVKPDLGWRWALLVAAFWPLVWLTTDPPRHTGSESPPWPHGN